jgi:O-antigen/teichoic acid export membrane protein
VTGPGSSSPSDKLVRNSGFLLLATAITAALGFVFWVVVARLFSAAEIGLATPLVSAMSMIGYLSLLGLNSVLLRFPNSLLRDTEITQSIVLTALTAGLFSVGYLAAIPLYSPELALVRQSRLLCVGFVIFSSFGAINMLTDAVFVARRIPYYNALVDGFLQGAAKLALPALLVGLGAAGIIASVGWGYVVAALTSVFLLKRVSGLRLTVVPLRTPLISRIGFSSASYISSILNLGPVMLLPMVTLHYLGAEKTAYYYLAFQIANLLGAASYAVGESLMAEVSTDESRLGALLNRSAVLLAFCLVPGVAVVVAASDPLLRAFGPAYAAEARDVLVVLSLAAFAVGLKTWAGFALKLVRRMGHLIMTNVIYLVVTVGLACLFARHGVTGVGWAWLIGNGASGLYAAAALFGLRRHHPASDHALSPSAAGQPVA